MDQNQAGYTIVELLASVLIMSVVMAGTVGVLSIHTRTHKQQDLSTETEQNLRTGADMLADVLRVAGYGVPTENLAAWIPWVHGFASNPHINTVPPTISVAGCSSLPVAMLSADAAKKATTLDVVGAVPGMGLAELLDTDQRRLILINDSEHAHVKATASNSITIDTDPLAAGNQGLKGKYPAGTPLCRVDVLTFTLQKDETIGLSQLRLDDNRGLGSLVVADSITDLRLTTLAPGMRYRVALTSQSEKLDPLTGAPITHTVRVGVTLRNSRQASAQESFDG